MTIGRGASPVLILYLFCAVYLVPVYPHFVSANELAHWAIDASLVEHGTLDVRWTEPLIGRLVDSTRSGERIYSNKPPGLALWSMPAYLAARAVFGPPNVHNLRWYLYFMRLLGATLPLALTAFLLIRRRGPDPFAVAALLFGTCLFFLGMLLVSHVLAGFLVFLSFDRLFSDGREELTPWRTALAGACLGLAVITDYTAAVALFSFAGVLLFSREPRRLPWLIAGGLPFAIVLAAFNRAMFGSFFTFSRSHEAWFDTAAYMSRGLWGFSMPTAGGLFTLLLSPAHGLFFYSPVLLLAIPAFRPRSAASWARLLAVVLTILLISSYPASHGGWGAGTRYLALLIPVIIDGLPPAGDERRPARFAPALLCFSAVLCVLPALTFVFSPPEFSWTHSQFFRPLLAKGFYAPNLGALVASGPWTLLPAVAAVIAALVVALGDFRAPSLPAVAGLAAAAIVVFLPVGLSPFLLIERQVVVETHFRPEGEIEAAARQVRDPGLSRQLRGVAASITAARRYPPDDWPYGK